YRSATSPNHLTMGFATTCDSCHSFDSWLGAKFDHNATGFPLTNGHANVPCVSCHINNNYNLQIALTDCGNAQSHLKPRQKPNNAADGPAVPVFAAPTAAHSQRTRGWEGASFAHSLTGFTLRGTHPSPTPTPSTACHTNNNYTLTSTDCMSCHASSWNS